MFLFFHTNRIKNIIATVRIDFNVAVNNSLEVEKLFQFHPFSFWLNRICSSDFESEEQTGNTDSIILST